MTIPLYFHIVGVVFAFGLGYLVREKYGNGEPSQPVNAPSTNSEPVPTLEPIQARKPLLHTRSGAKLSVVR